MGGRIFNPLQCSSEALHPEMGLGCKATVLPTVTNFNLNRSPPLYFPTWGASWTHFWFPSCETREKKQAQRSLLEANLEKLPCLILVVLDSFLLRVLKPQWKVSLSHIWQRHFLKCPHSRCWLFHTFEFNTGISFLLPNTVTHLEGELPIPSQPHFLLLMTG